MNEETYEQLNVGDRVSIVGASLGWGKVNPETLQINFKKGSQIKQVAKAYGDEVILEKNKSVMYC